MSQALSVRFQPPEQLTGPARDLLALLRRAPDSGQIVQDKVIIEPVALPPSPMQEQLNKRILRQKLRMLEGERALKTVDGAATWIVTDRMSINPDLGERIGANIVGAGVGTGRIFFGPPDLWLPAGFYVAIVEFEVTSIVDRRKARITAEVMLGNKKNLGQQTKTLAATGKHAFRLPFNVREDELLRHEKPAIEVRLNLKSIVGVSVTQVAVVFKAPGMRTLGAQLSSAGGTWVRRLKRKFARARA